MVYTEGEKKIGNYDSPEALANAVEAKNNMKLAEKIRAFSKKEITNESSDWREALRKELSPEDEKQMRDVFDDSQVDSFFGEGISAEEKAQIKAQQTIESIAPGAAPTLQKIGKFEKFWKNLSQGFENALSLFGAGKWSEGISALFLAFTGKSTNEETQDDESESAKKEDAIKKEKENMITQSFANKFFIDYSFAKNHDTDKVKQLTLTNHFQTLTFQEMSEMKKSDEKMLNFLQKIYGENAKTELPNLKVTLETLLNGKGNHLLKSIHKDKLPTLTYGKAITSVQDQMGVFGRLSETAETNAFGLVDEMKNIFHNDDPLNQEKRDKLGLNPNIFTYITSTGGDIGHPEELKKTYGVDKLDDKDKRKIDEIIDFGTKIHQQILNNPSIHFGMSDKIGVAFSSKPFTMTECLALYTMLGGKADFNVMNDIEKSFLILGVNKLLDGGRGDLQQGEYLFKVASSIKNNIEGKSSEIQVPEGVINFFSSLGSSLGNFAINYVNDISKTSAGFLKNSPELMGIITLIILLYPMAQRNTLLGRILPDFKKK